MAAKEYPDLIEAFYGYLKQVPAVTAIVSTRIYQHVAPESATRPFLILSIAAQQPVQHLSGPAVVNRTTVNVDMMEDNGPDRQTLIVALRDCLDGYHGEMLDLDVMMVRLEGVSQSWHPLEDGDEQGVYHAQLSFGVWAAATATAITG